MSTKLIHRIAGVSGCAAVALGASGQHKVKPTANEYEWHSYTTANRYHYYHTFALFTAQWAKFPLLTASIFMFGMICFCGAGYAGGVGLIGPEDKFVYAMPMGGMSFMAGWLTHVL